MILDKGCLARRIRNAVEDAPSHERILAVYHEIAACLDRGIPFRP